MCTYSNAGLGLLSFKLCFLPSHACTTHFKAMGYSSSRPMHHSCQCGHSYWGIAKFMFSQLSQLAHVYVYVHHKLCHDADYSGLSSKQYFQ